ncbi:hypothetical protein [Roseivirga pacifica]|uniref:hypothetical protein n=1 Tax=Roseivirga pacifica TaxID=1267423 RepID=UPI0020945639|nr:hypothetical protein [Roseivirga pacifica]MCO6358030.1 hypothetical protein [Roseivirga pacifica]MCO6366468.1 hypothetical protein [Roseivirga pacifica]MCO6370953.1 hypothetical protein [Roseivirga pacifica]MCO6373761.1 hypothetical protein [Roseivirga pacifica]MCO6380742.1 hypothetical protein [Roseivirga pacifica]
MKQLIILLATVFVLSQGQAQTEFVKSYPVQNISKVNFSFEYPELVKVETWDKQEVEITARVLINNGEEDDKFSISDKSKNGELYITSKLDDIKSFRNYVRMSGDDDDDKVVRLNKNGSTIIVGGKDKGHYNGTEVEIELLVKLPKNLKVDMMAKFGIVEVISAPDDIHIEAKFGGVDLVVDEASLKSLTTSTSWGQIYSNLDAAIKVSGDDMPGKKMFAELEQSRGTKSIKAITEFGNVYLRKN